MICLARTNTFMINAPLTQLINVLLIRKKHFAKKLLIKGKADEYCLTVLFVRTGEMSK